MNRLDRALAILLLLRGGATLPATALAARFGVSPRTIYRDIETLSAVGVPVYAEMGRAGGFRLLDGYFLPPVTFTVGEAVSLVLGLTLLRSLRAVPFAAEIDTAEHKLLAAVPDRLRATLTGARKLIGFERPPDDIFHPEPADAAPAPPETASPARDEGTVVSVFLQAVMDRTTVSVRYRSYRGVEETLTVAPCGMFWDRDRWYLAGRRLGRGGTPRLWRADRVLALTPHTVPVADAPPFDVRALLDGAWLRAAMAEWRQEEAVTIRLTQQQAARLRRDWYYRHATYDDRADDDVRMTFGEDDREIVFALLRWLGLGAELLEPRAWRADIRRELVTMLARYTENRDPTG